MSHRFVGGALVAFGVAGLAACGSGSPGGAKADFIKTADGVCSSVVSKVQGIGSGTDTDTLGKVSAAWNDAYNQLAALKVPTESDAKASEFLAGIHNIATTADGAYQSSMVAAEQQLVTQRISDEKAAIEQTSKVGDDYGFKACNAL